MAKTKGKGIKDSVELVEYKPELTIDLEDPEDANGLELGKEVTLRIKGKINRVSLAAKSKDQEYQPTSYICIKGFSIEVEHEGVFEELANDD